MLGRTARGPNPGTADSSKRGLAVLSELTAHRAGKSRRRVAAKSIRNLLRQPATQKQQHCPSLKSIL